MANAEYLLAIDNGTQSVRVLVFDQQGNEVAKSKVTIEPYFSRHPGWAEQDAGYYWDNLQEAFKRLWAQGKVTPDQICGVSLTTQRYTMINLDENFQPLRPAIVWMDQRQAAVETPVGGIWGVLNNPVIPCFGAHLAD